MLIVSLCVIQCNLFLRIFTYFLLCVPDDHQSGLYCVRNPLAHIYQLQFSFSRNNPFPLSLSSGRNNWTRTPRMHHAEMLIITTLRATQTVVQVTVLVRADHRRNICTTPSSAYTQCYDSMKCVTNGAPCGARRAIAKDDDGAAATRCRNNKRTMTTKARRPARVLCTKSNIIHFGNAKHKQTNA